MKRGVALAFSDLLGARACGSPRRGAVVEGPAGLRGAGAGGRVGGVGIGVNAYCRESPGVFCPVCALC